MEVDEACDGLATGREALLVQQYRKQPFLQTFAGTDHPSMKCKSLRSLDRGVNLGNQMVQMSHKFTRQQLGGEHVQSCGLQNEAPRPEAD